MRHMGSMSSGRQFSDLRMPEAGQARFQGIKALPTPIGSSLRLPIRAVSGKSMLLSD